MTDEPPDGSKSDELDDLDRRLKAIEARKTRQQIDAGKEVGAGKGYHALGELLGGILGGLGLGWAADTYLFHSKPWGMIIGTLLGLVAAVYAIVKSSQNR